MYRSSPFCSTLNTNLTRMHAPTCQFWTFFLMNEPVSRITLWVELLLSSPDHPTSTNLKVTRQCVAKLCSTTHFPDFCAGFSKQWTDIPTKIIGFRQHSWCQKPKHQNMHSFEAPSCQGFGFFRIIWCDLRVREPSVWKDGLPPEIIQSGWPTLVKRTCKLKKCPHWNDDLFPKKKKWNHKRKTTHLPNLYFWG